MPTEEVATIPQSTPPGRCDVGSVTDVRNHASAAINPSNRATGKTAVRKQPGRCARSLIVASALVVGQELLVLVVPPADHHRSLPFRDLTDHLSRDAHDL